MKTYTLYSDPGHGWLKVARKELIALDLMDKITCSYQRKDFVYLEEDNDASLFLDALKKQPKIKRNYTNKVSKIRNYEVFGG